MPARRLHIITIIHTIQIAIRTTPSVLTVVSILTDSASASSTILAIILSNTSLASSETTIGVALLFTVIIAIASIKILQTTNGERTRRYTVYADFIN